MAFPTWLRKALALERRQPSLIELRFPAELSAAQVEATVAAVSGLPPAAVVAFETLASEDGIRHFLRGEQATLDTLRTQLRVLVPALRIEPVKQPPVARGWTLGAYLSWRGAHALLRSSGAEESAGGLLASLDALAPGERLLLQVLLSPGRPRTISERTPHGASPSLAEIIGGRQVSTELSSALRKKYAEPLVHARILVAVSCGHWKRANHLLARLLAVYRTRRASIGILRARLLAGRAIERALARPSRRGIVLSPAEASALLAWPIGAPKLPGLSLGSAPLLFPNRRIPDHGRAVAHSTWPGLETRLVGQPVIGGLSHSLLVGPTGSGKSSLLTNLLLADIREQRGALLVDGKGDTAEELLARIPPERVDDVIVLDPAAGGPVPGLRVFGRGSDPELAADLVLGVLRDLFADSWGVRSAQWLRAGLVLLGHDQQATLGDLPYVFSDEAYRRRLLVRIDDPMLEATWSAFEAMHPREQANQLGAPLTKLSELLGRRVLRTILSQTKPTLDLSEAIRARKIVVVSLAPGRIGAPAARLLGALVVFQLLTAYPGARGGYASEADAVLRVHRRAARARRPPGAAGQHLRARARPRRRSLPRRPIGRPAADARAQRGPDQRRDADRVRTEPRRGCRAVRAPPFRCRARRSAPSGPVRADRPDRSRSRRHGAARKRSQPATAARDDRPKRRAGAICGAIRPRPATNGRRASRTPQPRKRPRRREADRASQEDDMRRGPVASPLASLAASRDPVPRAGRMRKRDTRQLRLLLRSCSFWRDT